ncbi:MAG TPA: cytochrome P450 [Novosphingobium sp.]|nr:cytochrome P450 [Novosphingobium sp.]
MSETSMTAMPVPSHVPHDRVVDFNVYDPDPAGTGHDEAWIALRDRAQPLVWTTANGGHWIATRGELIRSILADHQRFSSKVLMVPREFGISQLIPVGSDPPEHLQYRALVNKVFSPASVRALDGDVRAHARDLIDQFVGRGQCEFMADFARQLPIVVFFKLADLPFEDREQLEDCLRMLLHPTSAEEQQQGFASFEDYLVPFITARRAHPGTDLISAIVSGTVGTRPVSHEEAVLLCTSFVIGGLDTTLALMAFSMRHLAQDPPLRRLLAEQPDRIPDAVEEFCRRFPIGVNTREIRQDMELAGVAVKGGDLITMPQILHALDESEYPDPLRVDIDRNWGGNSAFGHGIHRCPALSSASARSRS